MVKKHDVSSNNKVETYFEILKEMLLKQTTSNMMLLKDCIDLELNRREIASKKLH